MKSRQDTNRIFISFAIVFTIILISSIFGLNLNSKNISKVHDIREELVINDSKIKIKYIKGNMIDAEIPYGNILEKTIEIKNNNNSSASFALDFRESSVSNKLLTYRIYESSKNDNNSFTALTKEKLLSDNENLGYNLYIDAHSTKYIKVVFKSKYEEEVTELKGILKVISNLTEEDIFISNINHLISNLNTRINELNGINTPGIYIIDASTLQVKDYYGYILIDARDISDLNYYLTIYNNTFMVNNMNYNKLTTKNISNKDDNYINEITEESVCNNFSKKPCSSFSSIQYMENGGRDYFTQESKSVLIKVMNTFDKTEKEVYVYNVKEDIENDTNIEGFILINNKSSKPEYYLYIHNNLFMISGYNYTKLGDYKSDSSTIRAYNETAFNLTNTKSEVCRFSGFVNCLDKSDNIITE